MNQLTSSSVSSRPDSEAVSQSGPGTAALRRPNATLISGLASAVLHMTALITLGLLFAQLEQRHDLELELAIRAVPLNTSLDSVELSIEPVVPSSPSSRSTQTVSALAIQDPTLVLGLDATDEPNYLRDEGVRLQVHEGSEVASKPERGQFFGAEAYGDEFIYVVDMSTSMGYGSHYGQTRFRIACRELIRSIGDLTEDQKFCVIMFCYRTRYMFDRPPRLMTATDRNKKLLQRWVTTLQLQSGTDPRLGVMMALRMKPDAIFLLSDGEFNGRGVNRHGIPGDPSIERIIAKHEPHTIPVHTIAFEDMLNRRRLRRIAHRTNGTHRFVGPVSDQDLLLVDLRSRKQDDVAYAMQCIIDGTHKVRDKVHLKKTVGLLGRHLTSKRRSLRQLAHDAMVSLADGEDLGPEGESPTMTDYQTARKRWTQYWEELAREGYVKQAAKEELSSL